MAASMNTDDEVMSAINVTPFVDVVLVLLIILMVTSTAITRASIGVDLPKAASAGETVDRTLNVIVGGDGQLSMDGEVVDRSTLGERVRQLALRDKNLRAVVSADQSAPYHSVIKAIDIVKTNGVTRFALDVERIEGAP